MTAPSAVPVDRADIEAAAARIAGRVRRTPVVEAAPGVVLKLELLQHAGSFKPRGAFNTVLSQELPPQRLVAASGGNHGLAVAHVGHALGLRTAVFVPDIASTVKVDAIRARGATVHQGGANYAAAYAASAAMAAEPGVLAIHAYDSPATVAGQGTLALELEEQAPDLDLVLVAVGGGGLLGGVAGWYAGRVPVGAGGPEGGPAFAEALAAGRPVTAPVGGVAADALGASQVGESGFATAMAAGVRSVLVPDSAVVAARQELWTTLRLATEPAGAAAYAALLSGAVEADGARVGVIVCGANASPADLV